MNMKRDDAIFWIAVVAMWLMILFNWVSCFSVPDVREAIETKCALIAAPNPGEPDLLRPETRAAMRAACVRVLSEEAGLGKK